ncbi:MAG: glycine/sarcosine/betaine reductase complex component C subunit beta [bacterium]|jgi:hypothetical protein
MDFPVVKGASYSLVHAPGILRVGGSTQMLEETRGTESEYLRKLPAHLRSYAEVVAYPPNQVFIGAMPPEELAGIERPWYKNCSNEAGRFGKYGEIMPEDEFFGLLKLADSFDLVFLEESFAAAAAEKLAAHPLFAHYDRKKLTAGVSQAEVDRAVNEQHAVPLRCGDKAVGYIRRAHDRDDNLSAHIILENTVTKSSGMLALLQLMANAGIEPTAIDYIIEASEEACGDMNQRGGGNFAKAIGELAGCVGATGSDTRSFCAGPAHALIEASALVQAGIFENVVVVAGGAAAKLGMNGRDHVAKGLPILEDVLGAFAVLIGKNDGLNPVLRTDCVGRHKIGSGSSPQAVMSAIVTDPLDKIGWKITDIDKYAPEMQNPEITEAAGAGDVPKANYKMIAALGVRKGDLTRSEIEAFVRQHGITGYAPTQGHIPSGVPFIGPARDAILAGQMNRAMIIGKGSLFLGRMTNQFDGISLIIERNVGRTTPSAGVAKEDVRKVVAEMLRSFADTLRDEQ